MSLYAQPSLTGGMDETLVEVATAVPSLIYGLLLFVFGFVFITGITTQKSKSGYADTQMWAVMASIATLVVTLLLSIKEGLVMVDTLVIVISITIMSALWLFLSKGRGETL